MDVQQAISLFIASRNARNLSQATIDWYVFCLMRLYRYTEENFIFDIKDVTKKDLELLLTKGDKKMSDASCICQCKS